MLVLLLAPLLDRWKLKEHLQSDGSFLAANRCLGTFADGGIFIFRIDCSIGSKIILFGAAFGTALTAVSLLMLSTESFREFFAGEP